MRRPLGRSLKGGSAEDTENESRLNSKQRQTYSQQRDYRSCEISNGVHITTQCEPEWGLRAFIGLWLDNPGTLAQQLRTPASERRGHSCHRNEAHVKVFYLPTFSKREMIRNNVFHWQVAAYYACPHFIQNHLMHISTLPCLAARHLTLTLFQLRVNTSNKV